jgi:membrane protein implicated in regulation of membrane protease activity
MYELLKNMNLSQWAFLAFLVLVFAGIVIMLVREFYEERQFRREVKKKEDTLLRQRFRRVKSSEDEL